LLKLFAVLLGGRIQGCNIELHDVVFVISDSIKNAQANIIKKWFGDTKRLHIDSSIELSHVDGHKITLRKEKPLNTQKRLYFVNFGGYKKDFFGEVHQMNFYVCDSSTQARERAKKELCRTCLQQHCDDNLDIQQTISSDVDDIIELITVDKYYLHFEPTTECCQLPIISQYRRLDTSID